jgi:hypothetical protein
MRSDARATLFQFAAVTTLSEYQGSRYRLLLPVPRITTEIFTTVRSDSTFAEAKTKQQTGPVNGDSPGRRICEGNSERVFGAGGT